MFAALVRRSLARHRTLVIALAALLSAFQIVDVVVAHSLQANGLYGQFSALVPAFIQEAMGGVLVGSFTGAIAVGFVHPLVMLSLSCATIYMASEPAGEVEDGLVDLVVARPVPRFLIVVRSTVVYIACSAAIAGAMFVTSRTAVQWISPATAAAIPPLRLAWIAANLLAIVWCFGAASLAMACHVRERMRAVGAIAWLAVFLYLLQFGAAAWAPLRPFARISPFRYYEPMQTLLGTTTPIINILGLLLSTVALLAVAHVLYLRRDL
jgi:ABC-type transport system involved in multi-copper enzyme maturation permease subunit